MRRECESLGTLLILLYLVDPLPAFGKNVVYVGLHGFGSLSHASESAKRLEFVLNQSFHLLLHLFVLEAILTELQRLSVNLKHR